MDKWLKHRADGYIFPWTDGLSKHPQLVEVTEEEAFPERFVKPEQVKRATKARADSKRKPVALSTDDIPEAPVYSSPELNAEASQGLPE